MNAHHTEDFAEKISTYTLKHLNALHDKLKDTYGPKMGHGLYTNNQYELAYFLKNAYTLAQIYDAHKELVASYKGRGRPLGSKNKHPRQNNPTSQPETLPKVDANIDADLDLDANDINAVDANIIRVVKPLMIECLEKAFEQEHVANGAKFADVNHKIEQFSDTLATNLIDLREKIAAIKDFQPTIVKLERPNLPTIDMGIQHARFPLLLKMCSARQRNGYALNIWVHGPAGTGKSTAAEKVANALGLAFYTTGSLDAKHEVLGFENAHKYVTTAFRQAWEFGGVYCLDEADGSSPQAMLALNGALAGSLCAFPDKIVKRHPDCIIIATANTTGHGASSEYSGRFKQDAASMDRFQTLHWPIDEALERTMCANQEWVRTVQAWRAKLARRGIKGTMITPRATLAGEALIAAGLEMSEVIESTLKKGMTDAQWQMVISA